MITNWVTEAAAVTKVQVSPLPKSKVEQLVARIVATYTDPALPACFLWESFIDEVSCRRSDGWEKVCEYGESHPILLYVDESDFEGVAFPSSDGLRQILSETPNCEFYVTNIETDFVLCFNHHDFLIGVGTCKDWLSAILKKVSGTFY